MGMEAVGGRYMCAGVCTYKSCLMTEVYTVTVPGL